MSRTGYRTWKLVLPRRDQGPVPLRINIYNAQVVITIGGGRPLLLDADLLTDLMRDLTGVQRVLAAASAADYIAKIGRERGYGPPSQWAPVLTPEEIEAADRAEDDQ